MIVGKNSYFYVKSKNKFMSIEQMYKIQQLNDNAVFDTFGNYSPSKKELGTTYIHKINKIDKNDNLKMYYILRNDGSDIYIDERSLLEMENSKKTDKEKIFLYPEQILNDWKNDYYKLLQPNCFMNQKFQNEELKKISEKEERDILTECLIFSLFLYEHSKLYISPDESIDKSYVKLKYIKNDKNQKRNFNEDLMLVFPNEIMKSLKITIDVINVLDSAKKEIRKDLKYNQFGPNVNFFHNMINDVMKKFNKDKSRYNDKVIGYSIDKYFDLDLEHYFLNNRTRTFFKYFMYYTMKFINSGEADLEKRNKIFSQNSIFKDMISKMSLFLGDYSKIYPDYIDLDENNNENDNNIISYIEISNDLKFNLYDFKCEDDILINNFIVKNI